MFKLRTGVLSRTAVPALMLWVGGLAALCSMLALVIEGAGVIVLASILAVGFGVVLLYNRRATALVTITYLAVMGDIRRLRDLVLPHPTLDPLLLLAPAIALILALPLLIKVRLRDNVSTGMLFLLILMVLEIFNPSQGGIGVGIGGVIFFVVPVLWFWVGRQYGTPAVLETLIYRILLPLGTLAGILGIYQSHFGFLGYQQAWINSDPINARLLDLGHGALRAFGFSTSATEYGTLVIMTAAASVGAWFGKSRLWILSLPFMVWAIVLGGGRGAILRLALAIALIWAFRAGAKLSARTVVRLVVLLTLILGCVYAVALRFAATDDVSGKQSSVDAAIAHQAGGLAHIGDERYSDAGLHAQLIINGIYEGFAYPIGRGLGYTTGAAQKFGNTGGSTEIDLSDIFVSLGLFGGLLYLYIIFAALGNGIRYTYNHPPGVALPALGVIVVTLGNWTFGGLYTVSAIAMFLVGAMIHEAPVHATSDRLETQSHESQPAMHLSTL